MRLLNLFLLVFILSSCGGKYNPSPENDSLKAQSCPPIEKSASFEELDYNPKSSHKISSFSDIKQSINSACMSCHMAPSKSGNFSYIDSYKGEIRTIAGETKFYPGITEIAEKVIESLHTNDESKKMPPKERRQKNPESLIELGRRVQRWVTAGKPQGSFSLADGKVTENYNQQFKVRSSESGECVPKAEIIGFDYGKDRFFSNLDKLPATLAETDLFTLDAYELAKKGTISYNVQYPLWADNAGKGRWVHFPMKRELLGLKQQSAEYDEKSGTFKIPENTRFYKTFYKKIKLANGRYRFKRIETRLIVVRGSPEKNLLGSYKWDEAEQNATLVETPYRDGTTFKDTVFDVTVDEATLKTRAYAIPGKHRCLECHQGAKDKTFVLGFTPLQLNHRQKDEGGREDLPNLAERTQVERLINYGMIAKAPQVNHWPKLEEMGSMPPKNIYELKAQGYFTGNCAHCHNPAGLAFNSENAVNLDLSPGAIFGFNAKLRSTQIPTRFHVHPNGDLDQSHIWRKVSDSALQLGLTSQMPMSTPGGPDCRVLKVVGQWIRSFESEQAAFEFEPKCKKENDIRWIDQDFTVTSSDVYTPRREDWNHPISGMPEKYKNMELSSSLQEIINKKYAVGYWNVKKECSFPSVDLPATEQRPWMLRAGKPKRPFGEIYYTTPGSWFYRTSCMKCHGPQADGNTALARGILNWSGGSVRVANLMGGMFGKKNENLKTFDLNGKNFSASYLIWMAMEGTRVQFPPELSSFLGRHGGQMLNQMREKCLNQISPEKPSSKNFMDHEVFNQVCFQDNLPASDPRLAFDPGTNKPLNPQAVEEWADKAATNIGFAIYDFLKKASTGDWQVGNDQCEKVHAKESP